MVMTFRPGQRLIVPGAQVYSGRAAAASGAVLDGVSGVIAAYSASRQLSSSYGGSYLQDVSGACATWYDQSGNTNHATQATSGSRPAINSNRLLFNGSTQYLDAPVFSGASGALIVVMQMTTVLATNVAVHSVGAGNSSDADDLLIFAIRGVSSSNRLSYQADLLSSGGVGLYGDTAVSTDLFIASFVSNGSTTTLYVNGTPQFLTTYTGSKNAGAWFDSVSNRSVKFGVTPRSTGNIGYYNGYIDELIVMSALSTTDHNTIGSNMASYYGLSWTTVT